MKCYNSYFLFHSLSWKVKSSCLFYKYFLATCIFLFFLILNQNWVYYIIDPGMALTPLPSSIGQVTNQQPSDCKPSALPLDHSFRWSYVLSIVIFSAKNLGKSGVDVFIFVWDWRCFKNAGLVRLCLHLLINSMGLVPCSLLPTKGQFHLTSRKLVLGKKTSMNLTKMSTKRFINE